MAPLTPAPSAETSGTLSGLSYPALGHLTALSQVDAFTLERLQHSGWAISGPTHVVQYNSFFFLELQPSAPFYKDTFWGIGMSVLILDGVEHRQFYASSST